MKKLNLIFTLAVFSISLFFSCSDNDNSSEAKLNDFDVCEIFTAYEGQMINANGDKLDAKATVVYKNANKWVLISPVAGSTSFPQLKFALDDLDAVNQSMTSSNNGTEVRFFKTDKINLAIKSTDSKGSEYNFSGAETSDSNIEKPNFCSMHTAMNVYTTYIGSVYTTTGQTYDHVKIQVSREGNKMVIQSSTHSSLATATIDLSLFSYKNNGYESSGSEYAHFSQQEEGIACGLTIKGTNGTGYSFLGATWNPY
ncbi:MAG: hypothetical protein LBV72_10930 [Tannerella sp.]|jgi:hypothetical protein|nr:hypothetical protein [Tannerella sp.]